jgi:hypothetical protein
VVVLYSFVGSVVNLCNCCYLDSTRVMCVLRRAHYAWWCVSKATSCRLWRDRYNLQGADFGALQVVSEPRFCRYPRVQSACRITLPTDVVESSVQTILLKMRWIVLIRSAILFLAYVLLSSYLCEFCVLSLIYFFEF